MDGASDPQVSAISELAIAYCHAIHFSRPDVFEDMCHERFLMSAVDGAGEAVFWDKTAYIERVASRAPFPGEPSFEILSVDVAGGETASVKLLVDVPPRQFEDYLGFFRVGGEWKLITKLFRTANGPAL